MKKITIIFKNEKTAIFLIAKAPGIMPDDSISNFLVVESEDREFYYLNKNEIKFIKEEDYSK